ncbi:MAG: carboxypeptidase regulatory-like domain-containing protein [Chloroflexaceae bacterium]|nr:carboxypeptidase regulatory-like domain-containing protein [Chloroflexaceae bacterium]
MNHQDDRDIEVLLLRCLNDEGTPEEWASIEQSPLLRQQLEELRHLEQTLEAALRPAYIPTVEALVAWLMGTLDTAQELVVRQAVQRDAQLQAEVARLRALLADDPFAPAAPLPLPSPSPSLREALESGIRSIIELVHVPQPAMARGSVLSFAAPRVALTLRRERLPGEDPSWTLRGLIRHDGGGQPAIAILRSQTNRHYRAIVNEEGIFRFSQLTEGTYDLTLVLDHQRQEFHLRQITLTE